MGSSLHRPILIVEDDHKTASILSLYLQKEGFETVEAYDGMAALSLIKKHRPSFILLDLMIPYLDGIELCKRVRQNAQDSNVPIMMVTAKVEEVDRLIGLSIGADDYVVKPFSPREVVARVKTILRRVRPSDASVRNPFSFKGLEVDPDKHKVSVNGTPVELTHFEFKLLLALMAHPGHVYSRETLLEKIYPIGEANGPDRTIDVHTRNLREKIEKNPAKPRYIKPVRRIGYQFAEE